MSRLLKSLLTPDLRNTPLLWLQGLLVLTIGVGIVAVGFVRRGFRWPCERADWNES